MIIRLSPNFATMKEWNYSRYYALPISFALAKNVRFGVVVMLKQIIFFFLYYPMLRNQRCTLSSTINDINNSLAYNNDLNLTHIL